MSMRRAVTITRATMTLLGALLLTAPAHAQDKASKEDAKAANAGPDCKRKERGVVAGTPVLGGPGLGFEIVSVIAKDACFKTAETTEDGSFALIILEKEKKVGWVATGLVDARLSAGGAEGAPVVSPLPAEGKVKAVRPLALRAQPRFDALAIATPIKEGTELTLTGTSPDGQWFLLVAPADAATRIADVAMPAPDEKLEGGAPDDVQEGEKAAEAQAAAPADGLVGWAPKYKVAETLLKAEDKPTAGSGGWAETRASRKSMEQLNAARAADKASAGDKTAAGDKPNSGDGDIPDSKQGKDGKASTEKTDGKEGEQKDPVDDPEPTPAVVAAPAKVLGRTQEAGVFVGYRFWQQNYQSDAFLDGFYKYDWVAPVGLSLGGHYGYRGEFPLVVEVRGQLGLSGWQHPDLVEQPTPEGHTVAVYTADGANPFIVLSPQLHLSSRVAWRLFATSTVDVDAGGIVAVDAFMNFGLGDQPRPTLLHGFYGGMGPSLVARSRLGENGKFGLLVVEAQIPVGGYTMQPDPVGTYNALPATARIVPFPNTAGVPPDDQPAAEANRPQGLPLHLGVGIDGRVRYQYAISHLLRIECSLGALLRQATIGGPGYRTGLYSQANNVDVLVTANVGATFGF
jgi:hypothetical protein